MTVPILPTIGEQIGPSLQKLSGTIMQMIDPHMQMRIKLREAIMTNPQAYRDMEELNPGVLTAMGVPDMAQQIMQIEPSSAAKIEKAKKPIVDSALTDRNRLKETVFKEIHGQSPYERTTENFNLQQLEAFNVQLDNDPKLAEAFAYNKHMGQTRLQTKLESLTELSIDEAGDFITRNPDISIPSVIKQHFEGKLPPGTLSGLLNHPQYGGEVKAAIDKYLSDEAFANRERLAQRSATNQRREDMKWEYQMRRAWDFVETTGTGSLDAANFLLHGSETDKQAGIKQAKAIEAKVKANPNVELTMEEQNLLDAYVGWNQNRAAIQLNSVRTLNREIQSLQEQILKPGTNPQMQQNLVTQLNERLQQKSNLGFPLYQADLGFDPRGPLQRGRATLNFKLDGKVVDPGEPFKEDPNQTSGNIDLSLDSAVADALKAISDAKLTRDAALASINSIKDPAIKAEARRRYLAGNRQ